MTRPKRTESLRTLIDRLAARSPGGSERENPMRWIRWCDFDRDIEKLWQVLPAEISAVAGSPRSGMYVASRLAIMAGLPLYAAHRHQLPTPLGHGLRLEQARSARPRGPILLCEDSTNTAGQITQCLQHMPPDTLTAVVYANPDAQWTPDFHALWLPLPHFFEWHFIGSQFITRASVDMDGVLCDDCPAEDDDDGERYVEWMTHVKPRLLPRTYPVGAIVTARLEKYRELTVRWLTQHGVQYDRLIMGPWKHIAARKGVARWKGQTYSGFPGHDVFIESDPRQAAEIYDYTKRPVICNNTGEIWI